MKSPIQIWIGRKCFEDQNLKTITLAFSKTTVRKTSIFQKDRFYQISYIPTILVQHTLQ